MKVWESLQALKDDGPPEPYYGICSNIAYYKWNSVWDDNYEDCFKDWSEFSGNISYPIDGFERSPISAYIDTSESDMWNPEHNYGAARLRLLDHCIEWFKSKDL